MRPLPSSIIAYLSFSTPSKGLVSPKPGSRNGFVSTLPSLYGANISGVTFIRRSTGGSCGGVLFLLFSVLPESVAASEEFVFSGALTSSVLLVCCSGVSVFFECNSLSFSEFTLLLFCCSSVLLFFAADCSVVSLFFGDSATVSVLGFSCEPLADATCSSCAGFASGTLPSVLFGAAASSVFLGLIIFSGSSAAPGFKSGPELGLGFNLPLTLSAVSSITAPEGFLPFLIIA